MYSISGEATLFLQSRVWLDGGRPSFDHVRAQTLALHGNKWLMFHFKYYQDLSIHHFNEVAKEISQNDCITDVLQLEEVRALSASSPVLPAKRLKYPQCHALRSYGQQGILSWCQPVTVEFAAEWTECGYRHCLKTYGPWTTTEKRFGWPRNVLARFFRKLRGSHSRDQERVMDPGRT